ncbi:hypothetical protein C3B79_0673 [Aeromonas hydrophila]|nr:hypothetical protein C3B79_0673 [Aeromonas hydrophila]
MERFILGGTKPACSDHRQADLVCGAAGRIIPACINKQEW